jgi:hypothetical protein
MRYEEPPHLPHDEAASVLQRALTEPDGSHGSAVIIGLALFDDDREFVEGWCTTLGLRARDPGLRGSAALSAGHVARRFGKLAPETRAMVYAVAADDEVDGRKHDAIDDVEMFLGRHP